MKIESVFHHNGNIPSEYTCDGSDVSPKLTISEVPKNAKSLALIMDDPDAPRGTFVHWLCWNIPPSTKRLGKAKSQKAFWEKQALEDWVMVAHALHPGHIAIFSSSMHWMICSI